MSRFSETRSRVVPALNRFFFDPASPRPLAALRIGVASVLLTQAWLVRGLALEFFSADGIVQGELAQYLGVPNTPKISWLVEALQPLGIGESTCIYLACGLYVASLLFLLLGLGTRMASVLAWFLHWVLMNTGYTTAYGADLFGHVFLFYLMWMPAGDAFSLDVLLGRRSGEPSEMARLGLRVLQIHLCLMYVASGIEKASGIQWWNGELMWRALSLPVYRQFEMSWLAWWPFLSKLAGWGTLLIELGYCVFIWPRQTRKFWVAATVSLHLGIAVLLGLGVFGAIMSVLTAAVFGISAEPNPKAAEVTTDAALEPSKVSVIPLA